MYGMYRGSPSWRCPWDRALQLGQGGGPIGIVGPISQRRGTIDTASLTLDHTYALNVRFLNQLYSGQLRVTYTLVNRGLRFFDLICQILTKLVNFIPFLPIIFFQAKFSVFYSEFGYRRSKNLSMATPSSHPDQPANCSVTFGWKQCP